MKKERILSLDFIRAVCTLGIIANHFSQASGNAFLKRILSSFPWGKGNVGYVLVTVFFMLSGAALYYSNARPESLKKFYIKRWKAIFPSFYIAYILWMIAYIRLNRSFFTKRSPLTLIFSVFGMDGYLRAALPTWYILGEWFLGAIVLCYLLYPLLARGMEKNEIITCLIAAGLFAATLNWEMLNQNPFRNIFSCLVSFTAGMILMKHGWFRNRIAGLVSLGCYVLAAFLPVKLNNSAGSHLEGLLAFMILATLGETVMKCRRFSGIVQRFAKISFEVFLLHHLVIGYVTHFLHPESTFLQLLILLLTVCISTAGGYVVWRIRKAIFDWFSNRKRQTANP